MDTDRATGDTAMRTAHATRHTLARLAMGTALLAVLTACGNRTVATGEEGALISLPPLPSAAPVAAPLPPATSTVVASERLLPGAPTYDGSRAGNIQDFEAVYGQPLSDAAAGRIVAAAPYTPPSYDDGTVLSQPLAAPMVTTYAPEPAMVEPMMAEPMMTETVTYGAASDVIYDESLTVSSIPVMAAPIRPAPVQVSPVQIAPMQVAPEMVAVEMAPVQAIPVQVAPMAEAVSVPAPLAFDTIETVPAPMPEPLSYAVEPLPMADASTAPYLDPFDPAEVAMIANDEAVLIYETAPAPLPEIVEAPQPGFVVMAEPTRLQTEAPQVGTYALPGTDIDAMPAPRVSPVIEVSPAPRQKSYTVTALARPAEVSPLTAPLPRPRPRSVATAITTTERAGFMAPLPQPRPSRDARVGTATTAGQYVSIGMLPEEGAAPAADPVIAEEILPMVDLAAVAPMQAAPMQAAPVQATPSADPVDIETRTPARLSGTSWTLSEMRGEPVSAGTELHFDDASAFAGGQGPCNSYGGEFAGDGEGTFSMANIFATKTACASLAVEAAYIDALRTARRYEVADDAASMTLLDAGGQPVARFTAF